MSESIAELERRLDGQLAQMSRQIAHNALDQSEALAACERELRRDISELERRVLALEDPQ